MKLSKWFYNIMDRRTRPHFCAVTESPIVVLEADWRNILDAIVLISDGASMLIVQHNCEKVLDVINVGASSVELEW